MGCAGCDSKCLLCPGNPSNCTECAVDFFLEEGKCVAICHEGSWANAAEKICSPCHTACAHCTGPDSHECSACNANFFLVAAVASCSSTCPDGFYPNHATRTCDLCAENCQMCQGSKDVCVTCNTGLYLEADRCSSTCSDGSYPDDAIQACRPCHSTCHLCSTTPDNCVGCEQGFFLTDTNCVSNSSCPAGTYPDVTARVCRVCEHFLLNGPVPQCVTACPAGFYPNQATKECSPCHSGCAICVSAVHCIACNTAFYLTDTSCVSNSNCPVGTYPDDATLTCSACPSTCAVCSGLNKCSVCKPPTFFFPDGAICLAECPMGYYGDVTTMECKECSIYCAACSSRNVCTMCDPGWYVDQSGGEERLCKTCTFSSVCPAGKYNIGQCQGPNAVPTCNPWSPCPIGQKQSIVCRPWQLGKRKEGGGG